MIVAKAPLRISFIGGGTDYPDFVSSHGGAVLAAAIDKYVYVSILDLPIFAREFLRFTYRITESVSSLDELQHPSLRASLKALDWLEPVNIATMADLPGRSGLGSSSAFLVALRLALARFRNVEISAEALAQYAIKIERNVLHEPGGYQDQYEAAYGGFRAYKFAKTGTTVSKPLVIGQSLKNLEPYFSLIANTSSKNRDSFAAATSRAPSDLLVAMKDSAEGFIDKIAKTRDEHEYVKILSEAIKVDWEIKSNFSENMVSDEIQQTFRKIENCGAWSYKLCGAGGHGFTLVSHPPDVREKIAATLPDGYLFPVSFANSGAQVLSLD